MITVGYYQFNPAFGEPEANLQKIKETLLSRKNLPDILVLPELVSSGYFFHSKEQAESFSEPVEGPTYQIFAEIASQKNIHIFGGFAEKVPEGIYNSSLLVSPDGSYRTYRKTHLFFEEKLFFLPGDSGLEPVSLNIRNREVKVGLMICFDWLFPETARTLSLKGAQILLHTSNLVLPYCPAATITRALENRVFIVLSDRIGVEKKEDRELKFIGMSRIVNPRGELLTWSDDETEEIKMAEIDPCEASRKTLNPYNDLFEDRRPDLYIL
jgi:predicted amidohydrolase